MSDHIPEQIKQFLKMIAFVIFFSAILSMLAYINSGCAVFRDLDQKEIDTKVCQMLCGITTTMPETCGGDTPDMLGIMQKAPDIMDCMLKCDGLPDIKPECLMRLYGKAPSNTTCVDLMDCF